MRLSEESVAAKLSGHYDRTIVQVKSYQDSHETPSPNETVHRLVERWHLGNIHSTKDQRIRATCSDTLEIGVSPLIYGRRAFEIFPSFSKRKPELRSQVVRNSAHNSCLARGIRGCLPRELDHTVFITSYFGCFPPLLQPLFLLSLLLPALYSSLTFEFIQVEIRGHDHMVGGILMRLGANPLRLLGRKIMQGDMHRGKEGLGSNDLLKCGMLHNCSTIAAHAPQLLHNHSKSIPRARQSLHYRYKTALHAPQLLHVLHYRSTIAPQSFHNPSTIVPHTPQSAVGCDSLGARRANVMVGLTSKSSMRRGVDQQAVEMVKGVRDRSRGEWPRVGQGKAIFRISANTIECLKVVWDTCLLAAVPWPPSWISLFPLECRVFPSKSLKFPPEECEKFYCLLLGAPLIVFSKLKKQVPEAREIGLRDRSHTPEVGSRASLARKVTETSIQDIREGLKCVRLGRLGRLYDQRLGPGRWLTSLKTKGQRPAGGGVVRGSVPSGDLDR
ncbi:hypothetical protein PR048_033064 [Dryococelus australis]|uniref:Uncharacterized protein n=1 Tax=Dryococelus australis TaxID=614101 RepID=A0ABQ9G3F9_9NEOP|nr:hypothetical protein PR048_033064 [Dryococelus australis]